MSRFLQKLDDNQRRGSKPRCHWITHGSDTDVAARLTALAAPWGTVSVEEDRWMPLGFEDTTEAELHKAESLVGADHCVALRKWWFKKFTGGLQRSPSFDIAATCSVEVGGETQPGILLVEAKAHDEELRKEKGGKTLKPNPSPGEQTNHNHICKALTDANLALDKIAGHGWKISGEDRYQMSNRFGWAVALMGLGYPVILVYLGFLRADEMRDRGEPFADHSEWEALVKSHGAPIVPSAAWGTAWQKEGKCLVPLIRSVETPFDQPLSSFDVIATDASLPPSN